jgi:hypothetical protein
MGANREYVWMNTDILKCEECRALSTEEFMRQLIAASKDSEANHLSTHMAFPLDGMDDYQPSSGNACNA